MNPDAMDAFVQDVIVLAEQLGLEFVSQGRSWSGSRYLKFRGGGRVLRVRISDHVMLMRNPGFDVQFIVRNTDNAFAHVAACLCSKARRWMGGNPWPVKLEQPQESRS